MHSPRHPFRRNCARNEGTMTARIAPGASASIRTSRSGCRGRYVSDAGRMPPAIAGQPHGVKAQGSVGGRLLAAAEAFADNPPPICSVAPSSPSPWFSWGHHRRERRRSRRSPLSDRSRPSGSRPFSFRKSSATLACTRRSFRGRRTRAGPTCRSASVLAASVAATGA